MVTIEIVKEAINTAESDFQRCWDTLLVMKGGPITPGFGAQFLTFQPTLARALFQLDELYRDICKDEKQTIKQKLSLESEEFVGRMRSLSCFRGFIKSVLEIGKSIGDAFAWFFYRKSQDKIAQHLRHSSIPHTPPGIGGKAEIAFLEIVHHSGFVAIYHGITSFLRIGDLSFIDLRSGDVVALGELKGRKTEPGKMIATLHLIGSDRTRIPFSGVAGAPGATVAENPETRKEFTDRLERQIREMQAALKTPENSSDVPDGVSMRNDIFDGYHYNSFQNLEKALVREETAYEQVGSGLLLVGLNVMPDQSLANRILDRGEVDFMSRLSGVVEHSIKLADFGSDDNDIRIGEITSGFLPGCVPPFWMPVDVHFLRKFYFGSAVVQTIYNPTHLLARLRSLGFTVKQSAQNRSYEFQRLVTGNRQVSLHHSEWFFRAIQHHLMKEETVIECIVAVMSRLERGEIAPNTKVEMVIATHVFRGECP